MTMDADPQFSLQDVIRCHLCDIPNPTMHCDICHENLCKSCVGEHLSENLEEHRVVTFKLRGSTPKCHKHFAKICEIFCEECNIPICSTCFSSAEHEQHKKEDIFKYLKDKKDIMQNDLKELESSIFPLYQTTATEISVQKANLSRNSQKLTIDLYKQRDIWYREIDTIIEHFQTKISKMESSYGSVLREQEKYLRSKINEISQTILQIRSLLDSNDICHVSSFRSRNAEFKKLPAKLRVSLPKFTPRTINRWQLYQNFGSLSDLAMQKEDQGDSLQASEAASPLPTNLLVDNPHILSQFTTDYEGEFVKLSSVSCPADHTVLTCGGQDKGVQFYNKRGEMYKRIDDKLNTEHCKQPPYITSSKNGEKYFSNPVDKTINILEDLHIRPVIKLWGWIPLGLCCSSTGDLLVIMDSDDYEQTKVVRYSGSTEKQTIQWNEQGQPLFLTATIVDFKYITENKNLDICVSDNNAGAVNVITAAGILRFRYKGHPSRSTSGEIFDPLGITTDSQGRILISDSGNCRIHILDQDGHFLRFIDCCDFNLTGCLCVDSRDNLYVAEISSNIVKKIKYCNNEHGDDDETNKFPFRFVRKNKD